MGRILITTTPYNLGWLKQKVWDFDVKNCPRCGEDHPARNFFYRTDINGVEIHPAWWSLCPVEGETLALAKDRDGVEKAVAID